LYEVRGADADAMHASILRVMDAEGRRLDPVDRESFGVMSRLSFTVMATRSGHRRLASQLAAGAGIDKVLSFRTWEEE
jgi:hypothetical protein